MELRLEHLVKDFSGTKAVNDVSITIQDGKLTGLLGPSGCGKSTTLYLISGLESPTSGRIFFGDRDVTALPPEKRGIGLVFQNYALYPHLTVEQNIAFPLVNHKEGKEEIRRRTLEMARLVQIEDLLKRKPGQLSGGQQQRVGVARALAADPEVLLMDEPFGALDPVTREALQQEMLRIHRLLGRTIVLVTHDIDEALRLADHLVLMDGGEVVQQGAPLEMLLRPKNSFVQTFFGRSELGVRLLSLREVGDYLRPDERLAGEGLTVTMTLREALSQFVARRCETLPVVDAEGRPCGTLHFADLLRQEMSHEGAS